MVARRKKAKRGASGWTPRLAGLLLCIFFILGVMTGFSEPGRRLALRVSRLMRGWAVHALDRIEPARKAAGFVSQDVTAVVGGFARLARPAAGKPASTLPRDGARRSWSGDAVALVERGGGFYVLSVAGTLTGPVSPQGEPDLPILSGGPAQHMAGSALVEDAAILVRAEAALSQPISEMRLQADGTASLFLNRARIEIVIDPGREAIEVSRAAEVLRRWHGRERLVTKLDMTTPGLAVLKLRAPLFFERSGDVLAKRPSRASSGNRAVRLAQRGR